MRLGILLVGCRDRTLSLCVRELPVFHSSIWCEFSDILPFRAVGSVILLMIPLKSVRRIRSPSTDGVTEAHAPSRMF